MSDTKESRPPASSSGAFAARLTRLAIGEAYVSDRVEGALEFIGVARDDRDGEPVAVFRFADTPERCYLGTLRGFKKGERFTLLAAAHDVDDDIGGEG